MNKKILVLIIMIIIIAAMVSAYTVYGDIFAETFKYVTNNALGMYFNSTCSIINGTTSQFAVC